MRLTASALRADIYNVLDRVLATGEAVEIERNGRVILLVAESRPSLFDRLVARPDYVAGDPDALVHLDWSHEWRP